jgi:hypothetical protein
LSSGGFLAAPCLGDGFRVRRALAQGDALAVNGMAPTKGLLAGDVVALTSRSHGVTVEVPALLVRDTASKVAQDSNQRVQVRYLGRILDANLRDGGVVELVARATLRE